MDIEQRFEQVTVIGAAGKMGSGISLLLAWEIVRLMHLEENRERTYRLNLIDVRDEGLADLLGYIANQSVRRAEKKIDIVRPMYQESEELQTDEDIARAFVADVLSAINTETDYRQARSSLLVFEAVPEFEAIKIDMLRRLSEICPEDTFFLSNTSSIPIGFLDIKAGLGGHIIGFHFYNPPAVQKLVELIPARTTRSEIVEMAGEIARRLGKITVSSGDIAGFIGNGYFIRDALHAISEVERLVGFLKVFEAIYALNKVSQKGLIRPMGIFQLIDYVGLDIFSSIMQVMTKHIDGETFEADFIEGMVSDKVLGGQNVNGSQKDGFFQYDGRRPVGVYTMARKEYVPLQDGALKGVDDELGPLADLHWKEMFSDPDRNRKLRNHFSSLISTDALGAQLTVDYLRASRNIGEKLVSDGVAGSPEDVNTVLTGGFGHLYGPFNDYF